MAKEGDEKGMVYVAEEIELDKKELDIVEDEAQLTEKEREMKELERQLNLKLDTELNQKGDQLLWPKAAYFIVPNEFGERFCYYGIKPLFFKYLLNFVGLDTISAKVWVSNFSVMAYCFPLVGAALSDSFLGKYITIVSLSTIYALGLILFTAFSIPSVSNSQYGSMPLWTFSAPIFLIAFGTGGIKPCVSTHGGDQYLPHQKRGLDFFFSIFYVAINAGSLISGYLTPYLKDGVECYGQKCYFLVYLICTVVFVIAMTIFAFGKPFYRIVPAPRQFLPFKAVQGASYAVVGYFNASHEERNSKKHWLYFAEHKVGAEFVEEIRLLGNVLLMILPTLFFWMCYDQGQSEWQLQYDMMNPSIFGWFSVPSEAFGNVNAVLIIIFVPAFQVLYRFLERRNIRFTILQRMGTGFFLMVIGFLVSGILQGSVISHYDFKNDPECKNCLPGLWQLPQWILLSLGEAMISPEGLKFTYTNVGKQLRAQSASFWLLMASLGDVVVSAVETALADNRVIQTQDIPNPDGLVSWPVKYYMYTVIILAGNIWFILYAYFVWEYKDENATMTRVPRKGDRNKTPEIAEN